MTMEFLTTRQWTRAVVVLLLSVMLTACGASDGDDEPSETSAPEGAQPTVEVDGDSTPNSSDSPQVESTPTNTDMSDVPASVVAGAEDATPETEPIDAPGDATPVTERDDIIVTASPASGSDATPFVERPVASPEAGGAGETQIEETIGDPVVGDGTTGASLETAEEATPAVATSPAASPSASPAASIPGEPVTVMGCEVAPVPAFTGEQTIYSLTTDANFRTGPGTDCDLALEVPIGEFLQVVVIGGPVTREDDGSEWVQISFQGTEGWISFDLLAPVQ
jgi:hypothetical protein